MRRVSVSRSIWCGAVVGVVVGVTTAAAQTGAADGTRALHAGGARQALTSPRGDGSRSHDVRPELYVPVPLAAPTPGVVFPFGGSHHQVPGVVAVNRAPYVCVPHARTFRDRAAFVAHLRGRHGLSDAEIARAVLVEAGQVRYVGD